MHFTKMQGAGNDYVYVDCTKEALADPSAVARKVSDRHFGIGSDGLILILPSEKADFEMAMYNADGSRGAMCGNGIRCVGKYVYDHALTEKTEITVDTLSGVKALTLYPENGQVSRVRVDMGVPSFAPEAVPVLVSEGIAEAVEIPARFGGRDCRMTCVSMGNPHAVFFTEEDVRGLDLEEIGPPIERDPVFPDRVNAEFVNVIDRKTLRMRVWERGSGETLACGTGACASAAAAVRIGRTERKVTLQLLGGDLEIEWAEDGHLFMTGEAVEVFEGEIDV